MPIFANVGCFHISNKIFLLLEVPTGIEKLILVSRKMGENSNLSIPSVEVKAAIERQDSGEVKVIPIFLRACDFKDMPFEKLQGYPKDAKSIESFPKQDEGFLQVAQGVRRDVEAWKK